MLLGAGVQILILLPQLQAQLRCRSGQPRVFGQQQRNYMMPQPVSLAIVQGIGGILHMGNVILSEIIGKLLRGTG